MKNQLKLYKKLHLLSLSLFLFALQVPFDLYGQKKEINIVVSCTEYIGNGTFIAHFGYENTDVETFMVDNSSSVVTYNNGQSKKYGVNTFLPGVQEKVFSQEFTSKDRVQWRVILPNGKVKTVDADIHSNHCSDVLNIIPYYTPPPGGKVNKSKIGAELTSLYETYIFDPDNFISVSDNIFQLNGSEVLIEVVSASGQYANVTMTIGGLMYEASVGGQKFKVTPY